MTWRPDLHPRDEFGRFKLKGSGGILDRMAAQAEAHHFARQETEYRRLGARHSELGNIAHNHPHAYTSALRAEHERLTEQVNEVYNALPPAFHMGMRPHDDGYWYLSRDRIGLIDPDLPADATRPGGNKLASIVFAHTRTPHDAQGRRIPRAATRGLVRVGDKPGYDPADRFEYHGPGGVHPAAGGLWYSPRDDRYPGGIPKLYSDEGTSFGEVSVREMLQVPESRARRHRDRFGTGARMEQRVERYPAFVPGTDDRAETEVLRRGKAFGRRERESSDMTAARLLDPRQPLSRMHTARTRYRRQQDTTWIHRLNARMEGERG